ncbi:hypothetical protein ENSA5_03350 [Enhygromyxa salina]|uniref:Uncharacterized protein n=1 Tax=Enhygromyxa salina TaxID=215803 RepID=A0A2S9YJS0_9BACT|nr:hypothetical protein [Enhygromyxa salina]PRQ05345.1 hypothetical protein ENSA5_03350 [Enhygromyxa salina]
MARKKTFPCGHSGKGRFCHRCAATKTQQDAANGAETAKAKKKSDGLSEKQAWREMFENDPIPLAHLPNKSLVRRARIILEQIGKGAPWHQFNGKRLQHDRNVVSIPLGRRYRILFRTDDGAPRPVEVLSHEAYNGTKPGRR